MNLSVPVTTQLAMWKDIIVKKGGIEHQVEIRLIVENMVMNDVLFEDTKFGNCLLCARVGIIGHKCMSCTDDNKGVVCRFKTEWEIEEKSYYFNPYLLEFILHPKCREPYDVRAHEYKKEQLQGWLDQEKIKKYSLTLKSDDKVDEEIFPRVRSWINPELGDTWLLYLAEGDFGWMYLNEDYLYMIAKRSVLE